MNEKHILQRIGSVSFRVGMPSFTYFWKTASVALNFKNIDIESE